jgi:hypothetical protein
MGPTEPAAPATSFDSVDVIAASGSTFGGGIDSFVPSVQAPPVVEGTAPRTNFDNPAPRTGGLAASSVPPRTTRDHMQTVGMFGLILLAAIYARFSGQPAREPKSLVTFAKNGDDREREPVG